MYSSVDMPLAKTQISQSIDTVWSVFTAQMDEKSLKRKRRCISPWIKSTDARAKLRCHF